MLIYLKKQIPNTLINCTIKIRFLKETKKGKPTWWKIYQECGVTQTEKNYKDGDQLVIKTKQVEKLWGVGKDRGAWHTAVNGVIVRRDWAWTHAHTV